jgi:UDP-3-O-[3-hydroxymyristoyl] glucosamine N-acyltransferase
MEFSINQVAAILGGTVQGNGELMVNRLDKIQDATSGAITFLSNLKYENFIYSTKASAVITGKDFVGKNSIDATLILVDDPYTAFTALLEEYHKYKTFAKNGVEQPSYIGENSTIGENHYRAAFSYIGNNVTIGTNVKIYASASIGDNVTIGNNTIIYAGVKIYADTIIGNNCTLQAGCVVGSDGFGFAPQADGTYKTIPQMGNVILEDFVDIGANAVIDCATMGSTIIRKGVKIDNLVQIAHNVEVGKNTVIAAQAGIAGSSKIGENCMFGGQVGVSGHITVANNTKIGAQSGIANSIKNEGRTLLGSPALDFSQHMRAMTVFKKLPTLLTRIEKIEDKLLHLPL